MAEKHDPVRLYLLVLRCQAGDDAAFARLYEIFEGRTLRYLQSALGDDGQDAQQELWLTVYRTVAALNNPRAFRTWLFRTARHRVIDVLRRRKRANALFTNASADTVENVEAASHDDTDTIRSLEIE